MDRNTILNYTKEFYSQGLYIEKAQHVVKEYLKDKGGGDEEATNQLANLIVSHKDSFSFIKEALFYWRAKFHICMIIDKSGIIRKIY